MQDTCCSENHHRLAPVALTPPAPSDTLLRTDELAPDSVAAAIDRRGLSRAAFARSGIAGLVFGAAATRAAAAQSGIGSPVFSAATLGKVHVLESNNETVRVGDMDPARSAVLTIDSGDVVDYPNTWINWGNEAKYGMSFATREPIRKKYPQGPYSLIGPVAVRGAEVGDIIECRMIKLRPIYWGWNSAPAGVGALPADFSTPYLHYFTFDDARTTADFGNGVKIALRPLQGVMSVQPAGDKPVSGIVSGAWGGNIVLSELVAGTSLFLPVQVPGGNLWTGDSHAAQGDGVVDQTAIETAMDDLQIQYVLHKKHPLALPVAETPTHWITLGFGDVLDDSITNALRSAIDWISSATALSKQDVYALYSIIGSFRVTQYAHQTGTVYTSVPTKTVHGMLPKSAFDPAVAARISAWLRTNG